MDINSLYTAARTGDKTSEEQLFQALSVRFRLFALQRIWDEEDCNDVVQNTMMVIAREYKVTDITTSFSAWAYKVLNNRILGYIKARRSQSGKTESLSEGPSEPSMTDTDPTLESRLIDCIKKVAGANRRYARVLNLYYQGFTTREVCDRLHMTPNHSYVALSRARSMLELCLEKGVIE